MFSREKIKTKPDGLLNKSLLLVFILLFALVGTYLIINSFAATPSGTANLWIDNNSGTHNCNRVGTAGVSGEDYDTASNNLRACSSIEAAALKALPGDTIRMRASTSYGTQTVTAVKTSPGITVIAEDGTSVAGITMKGAWIELQNIKSNGTLYWERVGSGLPHDIKFTNVDASGGFWNGGKNITWKGGTLGPNTIDLNDGPSCLQIQGIPAANTPPPGTMSDVTIDGLKFDGCRISNACLERQPDPCHTEVVRIDDGASNVTIKNSTFTSTNKINTAIIFTGSSSSAGSVNGLTLKNNYFAPASADSQPGLTLANGCRNAKILYNTWGRTMSLYNCREHIPPDKAEWNIGSTANVVAIGNLGAGDCISPTNGGSIAYSYNVWTNMGACGATDKGYQSVSYASDGYHLTSSSTAAIRTAADITNIKAQSTCSNSSDPNLDVSTDIDGEPRPQGDGCDAGADEFVSGSGGGAVDTGPKASLWVATTQDGGKSTCARASSPVSFETAKTNGNVCNTLSIAWGKCVASSSETIIIKANTNIYPSETITGDKADPGCRFLGEDGVRIASIFPQGAYFTLENVTIDFGNSHGNAVIVDGKNVTFKKVNLHGPYVNMKVQNGDGFTWQKGTFGKDGETPLERRCDTGDGNQPIWVDANDTTIDGIKFNKVKAAKGTDPTCGLDKTLHLEFIRVQGAKNLTVKNSWFLPGADVGSGHIFVTNHESSTTAASGLKVINNIFEPVVGSYSIQVHPNVKSCEWTFLYNTFYQDILFQCTRGDSIWAGNAGYLALNNTCTGAQIKNVYQRDYSGSPPVCGTNKYVSGPEYSVSALGFGTGGKLLIGSKAIDAGESLSESDYCTGTLVGAKDIDDDTRPQGTICDAGADEFRSGTTPTPKLPGDVDGNKVVDIDDLSLLLINWKKNYPQADFVKDNIIDIDDLSILLVNWGKKLEV